MTEQGYTKSGPDVVFEEFDGDLVVLNLATGQYFGFNAAAARVWQALMLGVSPAGIARCCREGAQIDAFVARLLEFDLIAPAGGEPGEAATALPEAMRAALSAEAADPTVEVYDDLADLIVADPIHDVDQEAGWPHLPAVG